MIGVFYGAMVSRQPELRDEIIRDLDELAEQGRLNPHVSARYTLEQAPEALRALMDRKVTGKVVVEPNG